MAQLPPLAPQKAFGTLSSRGRKGRRKAARLIPPSLGLGGEKDDEAKEADQPDAVQPAKPEINIFCLASGHLYERLLRIMILSVLKHTHSSV